MTTSVSSKPRNILTKLAIGGAVGAVAGYGGAAAVDSMMADTGFAEGIGLFVAVILVLTGGWMLVAAAGKRTYLAMAAGDQDEAPDETMLSMARYQALTNILAGVALSIPPLAGDLDEGMRVTFYAAVLVIIAIQTSLNLTIWRRSDELLRSVIIQSGAVSFWTFQGLFFLYAAAEKLALAPPIDSWTTMVILMGLYLVAGSWVAIRRGLTNG